MFPDGPTLLDKILMHSEGKKELEIPVAFQIPLDVPATYLRYFYVPLSKTRILQNFLINLMAAMSYRIRSIISNGSHVYWNGADWDVQHYVGTTETSLIERAEDTDPKLHGECVGVGGEARPRSPRLCTDRLDCRTTPRILVGPVCRRTGPPAHARPPRPNRPLRLNYNRRRSFLVASLQFSRLNSCLWLNQNVQGRRAESLRAFGMYAISRGLSRLVSGGTQILSPRSFALIQRVLVSVCVRSLRLGTAQVL